MCGTSRVSPTCNRKFCHDPRLACRLIRLSLLGDDEVDLRLTAQGVFDAWKDWAHFTRAHRLHKERSLARSKLRRDELLDQAQQAAQLGDMRKTWTTVKALAPKSKPKRLHKDGRMLSPTAELQAFGEKFGSSFAGPITFHAREHPPFRCKRSRFKKLLGALQVRKAVPPGAVPSAVWRIWLHHGSGQ